MKKTFRVYFGIEELFDDKFVSISDSRAVAIGKEKALLIIEKQYNLCKEWIIENIGQED